MENYSTASWVALDLLKMRYDAISVEVVEPRRERLLFGGAAHVNLHQSLPWCMLLLADGGWRSHSRLRIAVCSVEDVCVFFCFYFFSTRMSLYLEACQ